MHIDKLVDGIVVPGCLQTTFSYQLPRSCDIEVIQALLCARRVCLYIILHKSTLIFHDPAYYDIVLSLLARRASVMRAPHSTASSSSS
jgi:hypothetical protein